MGRPLMGESSNMFIYCFYKTTGNHLNKQTIINLNLYFTDIHCNKGIIMSNSYGIELRERVLDILIAFTARLKRVVFLKPAVKPYITRFY